MADNQDQGGPPPADGQAPQGGSDPAAEEAAGPGAAAEAPLQHVSTGEFDLDPLDETRATEALAHKRRLQRRAKRMRHKGYVLVHRADAPPVRIDMDRPILSFGRDSAECDIVLEGQGVSRRHAMIERDESGYFSLIDCKSRNGTYVDGVQITTMNLVDGDAFEIGEHRIEFRTMVP